MIFQDGYLDLYVGLLFEPNLLYKNNGGGLLLILPKMSVTGPIGARIIMGLGAIDYNRDGYQDLYITQDNYNGNILLKMKMECFLLMYHIVLKQTWK